MLFNNITFLALVTLLTLSSIANSQVDFGGGIKAGTITSQVHGDSYSGFNKIGFSAGAYSEMWFEDLNGGIQLEILYTQKGSRNSSDPGSNNFTYFKLELNYIEVPVTIKYRIKLFDLEAGLYYGQLLNSSQDNGSGPGTVYPAYRDYDIGGHVGASYYFVEDHFFVNFRISSSILSMRSPPDIAQQSGVGWDGGGYNTALLLYLGYKF